MEPLAYYHVIDEQTPNTLAEGVILPSGTFALSWRGTLHTHGTYPSLQRFQAIQSQMRDRAIRLQPTALTHSGQPRTFHLQRNEDWNGISGTGQVAIGFEFDHITVMQWLDSEGGTFWYDSPAQIERIHGHEGRTLIIRANLHAHRL